MAMTTAEKSARYRAKDVTAYRQIKRDLARTPEHREVRRLYMQKWRAANRARHNQLARESQQRNKHKHIERNWRDHIRRQYGITVDQYGALLTAQGGTCALCEATTYGGRGKKLAVDHCHQTGAVRGLLCYRCNVNLGLVERWYLTNTAKIDAYLAR